MTERGSCSQRLEELVQALSLIHISLVGENCVIGNSVELKNVIIFDNVQVPHYNYVGDSILGYKSHMGAAVSYTHLNCKKYEKIII